MAFAFFVEQELWLFDAKALQGLRPVHPVRYGVKGTPPRRENIGMVGYRQALRDFTETCDPINHNGLLNQNR